MTRYEEKKKRRDKEKQKEQKKQSRKEDTEVLASYWLLAPLIAIAVIIPMVMKSYQYDPKLQGFDWYVGTERQTDYFLHCKMVLLIITEVYILGAVAWLYKSSGKKLDWSPKFIPLAAYGVLCIVSTVLSENSYFGIHGGFEQFEPVWLLLGYCLIAYYAFLVLRSEQALRRFIGWFIAGIAILMVLGIAQGMGYDPILMPWLRNIIAPESTNLHNTIEGNRVYLTLYNSNYVGTYLTLVVPVLFTVILTARKRWQKICCGILLLVSVYVLYMSNSKAGFISLLTSVFLLVLLYRKNILVRRIVLSCIVIMLVAFAAINFSKDNYIINEIKNAITLTEPETPLKCIETKKDRVRITYHNDTLDILSLQQNGKILYRFIDGEGQTLQPVYDEENNRYVFEDERFPFQLIGVERDDFKGFCVTIEEFDWLFSNRMIKGDTTYYAFRTIHSQPMKLKKDTRKYNTFLEAHHNLLTKRGYIWARTLPLLKKYFWTGTGPDVFVTAFPNGDLVGMANLDVQNSYVTKPHSLYLQIAVQTGVPSLLCVLVFFGWYIIDSFRLYWKSEDTGYLSKVGRCLFISVIGYLVAGLTNDSMNAVTSIFYLLIGSGTGINYILRKQYKKSN